jgi:NDP-sugar pyrophosphorylase family protein
MVREPDEVAEKYGVLVADDEDRVEVFVEKPSLDELREYFHASTRRSSAACRS